MRADFALLSCLVVGCLVVPRLTAQTAAAARSPEIATPLAVGGAVNLAAAQWRGRCGDDPAWADTNFDDSAWVEIDPHAALPKDAMPGAANRCWYRARVHVTPGMRNAGIFIERALYLNYDVFVDGKLIGGSGGLAGREGKYFTLGRAYPIGIAVPSTGEVTIAVRVWRYASFGVLSSLPGLPFNIQMGLMPELTLLYEVSALSSVVFSLLGGAGIGLLVGLLALGLYITQREKKEYLWLAIYGLSFAGSSLHTQLAFGHWIPAWYEAFVGLFFACLILVSFIEFFLAFLGRRRGPWIRAYEACYLIPFVYGVAVLEGRGNGYLMSMIPALVFLPGTVMLGMFLFVEYRRHNPEAAILIGPTLLAVGS